MGLFPYRNHLLAVWLLKRSLEDSFEKTRPASSAQASLDTLECASSVEEAFAQKSFFFLLIDLNLRVFCPHSCGSVSCWSAGSSCWWSSSKKAACILFATLGLGATSCVSFFFSYILKKLSVDQTVYSQHATFINLHLISFEIKLSFRQRLMTLPLLHPSLLFLVVPYLMASIGEPQQMTKLFLVDPWAHQLGTWVAQRSVSSRLASAFFSLQVVYPCEVK